MNTPAATESIAICLDAWPSMTSLEGYFKTFILTECKNMQQSVHCHQGQRQSQCRLFLLHDTRRRHQPKSLKRGNCRHLWAGCPDYGHENLCQLTGKMKIKTYVSQVTELTKIFGAGSGHDLFQNFIRVFSWTYTAKTDQTSRQGWEHAQCFRAPNKHIGHAFQITCE